MHPSSAALSQQGDSFTALRPAPLLGALRCGDCPQRSAGSRDSSSSPRLRFRRLQLLWSVLRKFHANHMALVEQHRQLPARCPGMGWGCFYQNKAFATGPGLPSCKLSAKLEPSLPAMLIPPCKTRVSLPELGFGV